MRDGIYESPQAKYFVKDQKILMCVRGTFYQASENFFFGAVFMRELSESQKKSFDAAHKAAKKW